MRVTNARIVCLCLAFLCLPSLAQSPEETFKEWRQTYKGKKPTEMTKEERQAYKKALEDRARELGLTQSEPGYKPLPMAVTAADRTMPRKVAGTTIQYDSGMVTGFHTAIASSRALVNRYNSALNPAGTMCCFPVENSGSVTMVSFNMIRTSGMSAIVSIYSNIMGTTANKVTSVGVPAAVGLNTYTFGTMTDGQYANGTFLAGIFQFNTMFTRVGVDSNSLSGQGFHAFTLNDSTVMGGGNTGTALNAVPGLNIVFRISGNLATPVELMNFEIEE